jgi:hypothetical protein
VGAAAPGRVVHTLVAVENDLGLHLLLRRGLQGRLVQVLPGAKVEIPRYGDALYVRQPSSTPFPRAALQA